MILMWASSSEAEAEAEAVAAGLISRQHGEMRGLMHISTDLRGLVMGTVKLASVINREKLPRTWAFRGLFQIIVSNVSSSWVGRAGHVRRETV